MTAADITNPATQRFNPANGHIYEFVNTVVSWETAKTLAEQSNLNGIQGYLVNITSAAEQSFVRTNASSLINCGLDNATIWLGATDETSEGTWTWVTGPEAGTTFWQGAGPLGTYGVAGVAVNSQYSNWRGGRYDAPNLTAGDGELANADYGSMLINDLGGSGASGGWEDDVNSYTAHGTSRPGGNAYVIEYSR